MYKMSPLVFILLIVTFVSVYGIASSGIVCGPNSIPVQCENPCPKTCANYNDTITIRPCPTICINGCDCNEGFVKDGKNSNACVLPENCTK